MAKDPRAAELQWQVQLYRVAKDPRVAELQWQVQLYRGPKGPVEAWKLRQYRDPKAYIYGLHPSVE